jgi:hypothetical protein
LQKAGPMAATGTVMFSRMAIATSLLLTTSACAQDNSAPATTAYSRDTPIETLAADPAAVTVLNKDLPGLLSDPQYPVFKHMSLKTIQEASGGDLSAEDVNRTVTDLQALPPH